MSSRARLEENLASCLGRIRALRPDNPATLVAVTKSVDPGVALELARLGAMDLGESRVQEFERKLDAFAAAGRTVRWHFLGHLQRNKARRVVRSAHALHSVDSLRLLQALARLAEETGRCPLLFLQVKLTSEQTKTGLAPDELAPALEFARQRALPLGGLMTMAPKPDRADAAQDSARTTFRRLAQLAHTLPGTAFVKGRPLLSMGMSGDFEVALEEGADLVRIGSLLFRGIRGTQTQTGPEQRIQ